MWYMEEVNLVKKPEFNSLGFQCGELLKNAKFRAWSQSPINPILRP